MLLGAVIPAVAQRKAPPSAAHDAWACTVIPERFWLPLSVLKERLHSEGQTVLEARVTRDDCYEIRMRGQYPQIQDAQGQDLPERTVIYDPVSAKPLR